MCNETLDYALFYCGECDEEYTLPEDSKECVICGDELDLLDG